MIGNDKAGQDAATIFVRSGGGTSFLRAKLVAINPAPEIGVPKFDIALVDSIQTIGRGPGNSVTIDNPTLSREHARVFPGNNCWVIEDLNSTNGVFINEQRITRAPLRSGDIVKIAGASFCYEIEHVAPGIPKVPTQEGTQCIDKTMYAGHAGVVGALVLAQEQQALARSIQERVFSNPTRLDGGEALDSAAGQAKLRFIFNARVALISIVLGLCLFIGWQVFRDYLRDRELHSLVDGFDKQFRKVVENYESYPPPQSDDVPLLGSLVEHVNAAAKVNPNSLALAESRARILFLEFERKLRVLLVSEETDQAAQLVMTTRDHISPSSVLGTGGAVAETMGLLNLAAVLVELKRFTERFPDPNRAEVSKPGTDYLRKMQCQKNLFVKGAKQHHLVLSVLYPYFLRMVSDVDENDIRVLNRWTEKLKASSLTCPDPEFTQF